MKEKFFFKNRSQPSKRPRGLGVFSHKKDYHLVFHIKPGRPMSARESVLVEGKTFDLAKIQQLLERGVRDGVFPGCSLVVGLHGEPIAIQNAGKAGSAAASQEDVQRVPMSEHTVFDVANLTQIIVTTTIFMALVEEGRVDLNHRVSRYIPGFNILGKSPVTLGHLLSHTSGLPTNAPYYEELAREHAGARLGILTSKGARDYIVTQIVRSSLKFEPGSKQQYSELGFILLGSIIELLTGLPLEKAAFKYVFQPFGLKSSSYVDLSMIRRRGIHPVTDLIAPTEQCEWREKILWGEVCEENAWAMGGIAGHAGLFSSAMDLYRFATLVLNSHRGEEKYISRRVIDQFFQGESFQFYSPYKFGWDSPTKENGLDDVGFSEKAVGFNGHTGCSLWIEPTKDLSIVLMSNRVHPNKNNRKINAFRPELHKLILSAFS